MMVLCLQPAAGNIDLVPSTSELHSLPGLPAELGPKAPAPISGASGSQSISSQLPPVLGPKGEAAGKAGTAATPLPSSPGPAHAHSPFSTEYSPFGCVPQNLQNPQNPEHQNRGNPPLTRLSSAMSTTLGGVISSDADMGQHFLAYLHVSEEPQVLQLSHEREASSACEWCDLLSELNCDLRHWASLNARGAFGVINHCFQWHVFQYGGAVHLG